MRISLWIIILGVLSALQLSAQPTGWSPHRQQLILPGTDSLFLDSLPVVSASVVFSDVDSIVRYPLYSFFQKPYTYLLFKESISDTLLLSYQVVDLPLNEVFRHKDTSLILPDFTTRQEDLYQADPGSGAFTPFKGLTSSGSISRGITVGNNQDAVLNSNLNLQLSGDLGRNTQIRASITDNSIPVQADGYTQQLREFDRVYIELENPDFGMLRAGDYNMTSLNNYFLKFDKRISGAGIFSKIDLNENHIPLQLQGGISRGKFARNRFQAQEGNLGPYKLTGSGGEQFIIIISGSERVYVNGVLMKRGEQYDYTMDYNAGEITFTPLQPITKESRVVVEFQYTEQNFLRSVFFGQSGFISEKSKTTVQFYSEQDSKNQSLLRDLSDGEKQVLSGVGDNLNDARVSTIAPSEFNDDLVLYELTDSLGTDSVLVFSRDTTQQLYQASFTFLGEGQGNYILAKNDANGRVFQWVPPLGGVPQGSYAPVRQLIAPNKLQVLTVQTEAQLGEHNLLNIDLAASKNDVNLFSDLDEANDDGVAGKFNFLRNKEAWGGQVLTGVNYEFNQDNFRTIERIRRVEFARDWNLPLNYSGGLQMGGLALGYLRDTSSIKYEANALFIEGYQGLKNDLALDLRNRSNIGHLSGSLLNTNDSLGTTSFLRERGDFTHFVTPGFWVGIRTLGEWNQRKASGTDTLQRTSYKFIQYQLVTGFGDTAQNFTELNYLERWDDTARSGRFSQFSKVVSYGLRTHYKTAFNSTLTAQVNIRDLNVLEPVEKDLERTFTTRVNYLQRFFQNSITSTTFYEAGSGTEPRRSFSYIEVPAGTGTYTHTDYNDNGIKELDEFEIAPTPDLARYVRVFTPSNVYLRTSLQKFGQNLNINTPPSWKGAGDIRAALARFSALLNYQLDRKTLLNGTQNELNPFAEIPHDSLIVALNNNFRSTLFFNRSSTEFGMNYTYRKTDNRNLLSFGVEQRSVKENALEGRYLLFDSWLLKAEGNYQMKKNISANFSTRNFSIDRLRNIYSLAYQPGNALVVTGRYQWDDQESEGEQPSRLFSQTIGADFNYNRAELISAQVSLNYIKNDFMGEANSPAGFEMLEGLKPGDNGTWQVILQRTLRKNILISLNYNGRVSPDTRPIHTGNLEVKAFF